MKTFIYKGNPRNNLSITLNLRRGFCLIRMQQEIGNFRILINEPFRKNSSFPENCYEYCRKKINIYWNVLSYIRCKETMPLKYVVKKHVVYFSIQHWKVSTKYTDSDTLIIIEKIYFNSVPWYADSAMVSGGLRQRKIQAFHIHKYLLIHKPRLRTMCTSIDQEQPHNYVFNLALPR